MAKYVFKEDFDAIGTNPIDYNRTDQNSVNLKHKFKKGDVFEGKRIPVNAGINTEAKAYMIQINSDYYNLNEDDSFSNLKGVFEVPERVVSEQTFLQKHKTNLLIVGALVVGYLAYKKFKK